MKPCPRGESNGAVRRWRLGRAPAGWSPAARAFLSVAVVWLSAPLAQAELTKDQCVDANGKGQELRRHGAVSAAREQFSACAATSCPPMVRDDCTRRLDEADKAQPTVAFEAQDATGNDLSAVRVTMDGKPWTDELEGKALPADPGRHLFVFTTVGLASVSRSLVLTEGEKGRRERIVLSGAAATATPSPKTLAPPAPLPPIAQPPAVASSAPIRSGERTPFALPEGASSAAPAASRGGMGTQRIVGLTFGVAGVVGLGVGTVFGLLSTSAWNRAKSACGGNPSQCTNVPAGQSDRSTAETDATVSTAAFVAGGALLAAGAIVFLVSAAPNRRATSGWTIAPAIGPREAGLAVTGGF